MGFEIHFEKQILWQSLGVHITERSPLGLSVAEKIVFNNKPVLTEYYNPIFSIEDNEAQRIMDELWNIGVRPSEVGSPGQIASMNEHIKDLRFVVQNLLPINKG